MKTLLYLSVLLYTLNSTAQESVELWQKNHPDVLFFQEDIFNSLSHDQQEQLGSNVIIYQQEITPSDIQKFELANSNLTKSITIEDENGEEIKYWLATHSEIKIITQTFYSSLTSAEQLIYTQNGVLILTGDSITLNDIKNYEAIY